MVVFDPIFYGKRACSSPAEERGGGEVTEFVGLRTRLKPGMEEAYEKAHAEVWPELVAAQREVGISRWLIFRDGVELFHTVECENFERAVADLSRNPVDQRWQAHMARYVVVADDRTGAATDRLRLVYAG
jgi:L-rhamnose mutarotase